MPVGRNRSWQGADSRSNRLSSMPTPSSTPASHLILVRHGESVLGRAKRYAGHRDTPLTPRGRAQIRRLRPRFQKIKAQVIVSSDLVRCLETARILAPGLEIIRSARLRELDFGEWDGRTAVSCRHRDPRRFDRWMRDPWTIRTPGGECLSQVWTRVRGYVSSLVRRFPGRTLALVTHAGPIRTLIAPDPSRFWKEDVPPAALIELDWEPERRCRGE